MFKKVAFTYYPVTDVARARKFYEETLGLKSGSAGNQGGWWAEYDLPGGGCLAITNFTKEDPSDTAQDALKVNEELHRKLQQGSQQTQGEVLELELEQLLRTHFPLDQIESVPKGIGGADVIQRVVSKSGNFCGTIVWESKRTKAWSEGWPQKLKDDQRAVKAEIAVLVSEILPKDCKNFGQCDGIWVSNSQCAVGLAAALRVQLVEVAMTKLAAVGKNEKMETLYQYLSGSEFRQRVEAIVEAFVAMQEDLQEERRVTERRWAKREKQIQKVISNTSGMYGDFQGLIGSSLQTIPSLTAQNDVCSDEKQNGVSSDEKIVVNGLIEDKSPFDDLK